jgi:S1-C subfamily serine protease
MHSVGMTMLEPVGSFAPMLEHVIPAVVSVLVTGETLQPVNLEPRMADGRPTPLAVPERQQFRAGGSGVVIDAKRGLILTNNHVIENAVTIEVALADGRRLPATLVGTDIGTDVAVIRVEAAELPVLPIGSSDTVRVGDVVLAVGNPFGLEGTATLGIVSAKMRTEVGHGAIEDFMQIDAPINPGNSGGALVNVRGELVGINTAGPGPTSRATGIGFAIPIDMARIIMTELVAHGRMIRGSLGIDAEDLSHGLMQRLNTPITRGAHVVRIVAGSPAAIAGVAPGDIVTSVSGKPVRSASELDTRIASVPVGTKLVVVVNSKGRSTSHELVVSKLSLAPEPVELPVELGSVAGATVGDIVLGDPLFGSLRGARILSVPAEMPAWRTGLLAGDVIVAIDGTAVHSTQDLMRVASRAGMHYRVKIVRDGVPAWVRVAR